MVWFTHDDVIQNLNFQQLADPDEVAGNLNVSLRRSGIAAWMIVLCGAPIYVERVRENKSIGSRPIIHYKPDDPGNVGHRWHPPAWHRP